MDRRCASASWIKVASLTSTSPLGRGCASVCIGIEVEIGVWLRHLGSWIWVWWVSAFGFGGFVTCGCGFVLWCCVGALVVVVPHFFLFCL